MACTDVLVLLSTQRKAVSVHCKGLRCNADAQRGVHLPMHDVLVGHSWSWFASHIHTQQPTGHRR